MKKQKDVAAVLLDLSAVKNDMTPIQSVVIDEGVIIELNNEDYLGDYPLINSLEEDLCPDLTKDTLVINVSQDACVVSKLTLEGETSVTTVCINDEAAPDYITTLDYFETIDIALESDLPEFFMLGKDGLTLTLDLVSTHELELPRAHVRDDETDHLAQLALPLLGESDDIRLILMDHVTPEGDILTSLVSQSRAPEKTEAVFEFHGLQKKSRKPAALV